MGIDSHYGDPDIQESGKWFPISDEETELRIRHVANEDYMAYLRENLPPEAREMFGGRQDATGAIVTDNDESELSEDKAEDALQVMQEAAARHILVDWKHLCFDGEERAAEFDKNSGENIGYTTENAEKVFDILPALYNEVMQVAADQSKFKQEQTEQDKGKS